MTLPRLRLVILFTIDAAFSTDDASELSVHVMEWYWLLTSRKYGWDTMQCMTEPEYLGFGNEPRTQDSKIAKVGSANDVPWGGPWEMIIT